MLDVESLKISLKLNPRLKPYPPTQVLDVESLKINLKLNPRLKPYPPPQVLDEESLKIMRMIETQPVGMRYD